MANEQIKISELTEVTSVTGNEEMPVVQSGSTKKMSLNQAKDFIGGAGVIIFPKEILDLTGSSSSEEILAAFGGIDKYKDLLEKLSTNNCLVQIGEPSLGSLRHIYTLVEYAVNFASNKQSGALSLNIYNEEQQLRRLHFYLENNGTTARCGEASTFQLVRDTDVLTKTNTSSFTPTQPYQPATKKYVDDKVFLLTISDTGHQELVSNQDTTGETAATKINTVFGSADNFKSVVSQLMANKRLVIKITETERFQPGVIHSYMNTDKGAYELSFDYNYSSLSSTGATLLSKRILIAMNNNYGNFFIVRDIVTSDNLTTITKKSTEEYTDITNKDVNTVYCVTD